MRKAKKPIPHDETPPKIIVNSRGAPAYDMDTFLESGIVQRQIAESRALRLRLEAEKKKASKR